MYEYPGHTGLSMSLPSRESLSNLVAFRTSDELCYLVVKAVILASSVIITVALDHS
jgi:hypothetical protein